MNMLKLLLFLCCFYTTAVYSEVNEHVSVLAFAGSTRCESINKKLAKEAARIAQDMGASVKFIDLRDYRMPLYEGDLETAEGAPAAARQLKELMDASQVIILASPEYNGSYSPLLKNTLDWISRVQEGFNGKPFIIMSTSPGQLGGTRGLVLLKTLLEELGAKVEPIQVSVPKGYEAFDQAGRLKDAKWESQLRQAMRPLIERKGNPHDAF